MFLMFEARAIFGLEHNLQYNNTYYKLTSISYKHTHLNNIHTDNTYDVNINNDGRGPHDHRARLFD